MQFLVVEDEPHIAELVRLHLIDYPAEVTVVHHGWAGLDAARTGQFDLVVLDWMLPGLNGLDICRQLRASMPYLPILMLTAKSEEHEKIAGFEQGADDYLTKPFSPGELIVRVKAILRRSRQESTRMERQLIRITRGALVMDLEKRTVYRGSVCLDLTVKEYELLQLFMQNPGRNYTRTELLDLVWGEQFEGLEHTVNSHINRLRAKVEEDPGNPQYILTAWGVGYKFGVL
jgi:two-component system, OmpR family, alkaline phosphatase synthesis response regulator PhoP